MTPAPLSCGIIGTGKFAHVHAQALAQSLVCRLAVVMDAEKTKAQAFALQWQCTTADTIPALLAMCPAIVTLATPNHLHKEHIAEIMHSPHAPKLLIVEKPLCTTAEDLRAIGELVRASPTYLVVDHSRRFNSGFADLQKLIRSGSLGKDVLSVQWKYYAGWLHTGVHVVDTLRMLIGEMKVRAAYNPRVDRFADDPLLDVELSSVGHPKAAIHLFGVPEHPYASFEGEIMLSNGRIRIQWDDLFVDALVDESALPRFVVKEHRTADPVATALRTLYAKCAALINEEDKSLLNDAGFATARGTMKILLEAKALVA